MEQADFVYRHHLPSSMAALVIQPLSPNQIGINSHSIPPPSSPTLTIQFNLCSVEKCWYRPIPSIQGEFQGARDHNETRILEFGPSAYMSSDTFYSAVQQNLTNCGEEFDRNYRHDVIRDMIRKVGEVVADEGGLRNVTVRVGVILAFDHYLDERVSLFEESSFFNLRVPASKSSIKQLAERMDIDDDDEECVNDDCVICFEQLGKENKIFYMPCLHMFHGDCITKWLENAHHCPICRYEMPTAESAS